jgi:hypothetical protein
MKILFPPAFLVTLEMFQDLETSLHVVLHSYLDLFM